MSVTNNVTLSQARRLGLAKKISDNNLPYTPATLKNRKGDLSKSWLLEYECWNAATGQLARRQKRIPSKLKTAEARTAWAEKMIPQINNLLQLGYHIDPTVKSNPQVKSLTIRQAFQEAEAVLMVRLARESRRNFKSLGRRFLQRLQANGRDLLLITSLSQSDFVDFLDHQQVTNKIGNRTRNNNLSYFKTFTKHFLANQWITTDPTSAIPRHKETEPEISSYTASQKSAIISYLKIHDPQLHLYLRVIYFTFRRCTETRLIQLKHIDFKKNTLHIPSGNAKGGLTQNIYLPQKLKEQLIQLGWHLLNPEWYLFGNKGTPGPHHYSTNSLGNRYRRRLKEMGIYQPFATIMYAWKHTGITDAHEIAGVKPRTSQDQAGHKSLDMHMRYLRRLGVDKASEVDNMPDL